MEIVKAITARHDREQEWDKATEERKEIVKRYDAKLKEMELHINDTHSETEAKIQQVQAELFILTECMQGVLDGLHQLKCNGKVTEASEKLDNYLNERAHTA
jgi:hypothetical protein